MRMLLFKPSFFINQFFLYLLLLLLVSQGTIFCQPKQIVFKHYGIDQGFASNEAADIVQTAEGLMWISTADGLARFDSENFKFYQHNHKDTNSIINNYCRSLEVDKRNRIWIAADDDLDIFDPATEIFTHVKRHSKTASSTHVKPTAFYYDKAKDMMWVATLNGLYFSKEGSVKLESASTFTRDSSIFAKSINTVISDGSDGLWLTGNNRIIKLNLNTGATENYVIPTVVSGRKNGGNIHVVSSYLDQKKTLWLGTFTSGLFSFNTTTKTFEQFTYRDITKEENTIFSIKQTGLPGQEDILFCSAAGAGFTAFNTSTQQFTTYQSGIYNSVLGIMGNAYGLSFYDNKMWIGSSTGLHCYDYSLQLFEKKDISIIADGAAMLPTEMMNIERNALGKDERLWLNIPYKGAYIYDLVHENIIAVPAKIKKYTSVEAGLFSMFIDHKNTLWLSTNAYGLIGYNIKQDIIISPERKLFYNYLEWVHQFFEDSKNNIWLCTFNGLFVMDAGTQNAMPVTAVNDLLKNSHISKKIVSVTEDEYGKIWITADYSDKKNAGIIKLDPITNTASIVYNEALQNNGINPSVDIRSICSNKKGKVFVVFFRDDIFCFNSNANGALDLKEQGRQYGLNNTAIDDMLSDGEGNIWCNNSLGIAQYKINQHSFSNYSLANYELSTTNVPSFYISPNSGKFYIGQSNGFLLFNHANNNNDINAASLLFNEFKIYNTSYQEKIKDGDQIVLNYQQDMVSIEFALLSYSNANENTYSWMLEGLEKDWNISKNNIATYSHLTPGNYTLLVKAANSNGDWKTNPIKLHIKITPAFYATWWFRILVVLLMATFVWRIVQRRIKRIKEKFELRNRIASDLHDEIGSTLTSINILSNVSQQAMDQQPAQVKVLLEQISSQSKTIQQSMSDIVWSIRPDNEKIENLLVRIREYAGQTLEPLNINTVIEADEILVDKILPMHYRKDMLLLCKEAVNNIAKHSSASVATIAFSCSNKKMVVTITDNGQWKGNNSGTGTKTMQERALALGAQLTIQATETGTIVSLLLPLP